jgi:hypothetical protein
MIRTWKRHNAFNAFNKNDNIQAGEQDLRTFMAEYGKVAKVIDVGEGSQKADIEVKRGFYLAGSIFLTSHRQFQSPRQSIKVCGNISGRYHPRQGLC